MYRAERRREIKEIKWKLKWLEKHSNLQKLLKDKSLEAITEDDRLLMVKGEHEDKELQKKFTTIVSIVQETYKLEERLQYLEVGYKAELVEK